MIITLPPDLVPSVNSEVRKVVTAGPNRILAGLPLAFTLIATVATALLAGKPDPKGEPVTGAATNGLYVGLAAVTLAAVVFGVLGTGAEFRHHSMPVTALFSADRDRLAIAKLVVTGVCAALTALAVEMVALAALFGFGRGKFQAGLDLFAVLGGGLLAAICWSLIGAGLGLLLRSSSTALLAVIGWLLIVEPLIWVVAHSLGIDGFVTLLPGSATISTIAIGSFADNPFLAPGPVGVVVLLLWTAGLAGAGWWALRTRDL
ncbi:ABC transporter permease [Nocardia brasiliensis]|uniref:ABC transporter permease n=1 Tax=Nocardia brasiliensis TaxID=37326 RepID=UPI0018954866|nr:ABC transporter permease [Nocardia brasiliensis]MBF6124160.1 ABC transporter permease [Nocardia brasiliensis]